MSRRKSKRTEEIYVEVSSSFEEQPDRRTKKKITMHDLRTIKPLTPAQEDVYHAFQNSDHICMHGSAGTGKTYLAMYLAMVDILDKGNPRDRIIVVRSTVQTRELGFLPGNLAEKTSYYEAPYIDIIADLTGKPTAYEHMKQSGQMVFMPTAFIRGLTWNNSVVIIDEGQNLSFHEINSAMTRIGHETRVFFLGDMTQSDLFRTGEKEGFKQSLNVIRDVSDVGFIEFGQHDIVRGPFVSSWIKAAENYQS